MKKLGIDMGSNSIGWFIREIEDEKTSNILKKGVITFDSGMLKEKNSYSSPTKDRREKRNPRVSRQHKKYRKHKLLKILVEKNMVPLKESELAAWTRYRKGYARKFPETDFFKKWLACDFRYEGGSGRKYNNPYELRVKAIDEELHKHEFGRALYHIAQRRGYKDIGEKDKETKEQINNRENTGFKNSINNNRTLAEALKKDFLDKKKRARNQYPYRKEYENELVCICSQQGLNVNKNEKGEYEDELFKNIWKAIIWQLPLKSQRGNVGKCSLEPNSNRSPISHPLHEIFRAWSFINNIKYENEEKEWIEIDLEKKRSLFKEKFLKKEKDFKFEEINTFLCKKYGKQLSFNYLNKRTKKYDSTVSGMPTCKGLIDIFGEAITNNLPETHQFIADKEPKIVGVEKKYSISDLWHVLYDFDDKDTSYIKKFAEEKLGVETKTRKKAGKSIETNSFVELQSKLVPGYANLSIKAIRKIIPFLLEGYRYDEAVVLAKCPELIDNWQEKKPTVLKVIKQSNVMYNEDKKITEITNNFIAAYKALDKDEIFAYKDYQYQLQESDIKNIKEKSEKYYGEVSWEKKEEENKKKILNAVEKKYQEFFHDEKRDYAKVKPLKEIIKEGFKKHHIELKGELYHHSANANPYGKLKHIEDKYGRDFELLPRPIISSIKNPMFNKAMTILQKLINHLIKKGYVDEETEIIIELARELNDNNKRIAIERYQLKRESRREKYRKFLEQYKNEKDESLKIDNNHLIKFELWNEQVFKDKEGKAFKDGKDKEIDFDDFILSREKDDVTRYELWMEQKATCMYTGKLISICDLFSTNIDIEHTIPRSILPDNTRANKTIAYKWYNKDVKGKKLPSECPNYEQETEEGTAIKNRLKTWEDKRDRYKRLYESKLKAKGKEDEDTKNDRIQDKHENKMHYDYWKDKLERFTCTEVKENWARRQLVDTQLMSKYARWYLKGKFNKVSVQKGSVTAEFRKIYGIQDKDKIKSRNKHTHHTIDAFVLTMIPSNGSKREEKLKKAYEYKEKENKQYKETPFGFKKGGAQKFIEDIETETLVNYLTKDHILKQTKKYARKRGKLEYLKKEGKYVLDKNGEKIKICKQGNTIRGSLFKETYLGKIRMVEREESGNPKKDKEGNFVYKKGEEEFEFVKRVDVGKAKVDDIIDPVIGRLVKEANIKGFKDYQGKVIRKDYQGNVIGHVRVKTKKGREVKERLNYKSKHGYKNYFYSEAGEVPWALMLQKTVQKKGAENMKRKMIPIPIHEIAQVYREKNKFDITYFMDSFGHKKIKDEYLEYPKKYLMKVGQKVLVLKDDNEYEKRKDIKFQSERLYRITQFDKDQKIILNHHLNSRTKKDIEKNIKKRKNEILREYEKEHNIPYIKREKNENDNKYYDRVCNKNKIKERLKKLPDECKKKVEDELSKYKVQYSKVGDEPSILGLTEMNWNFLYENIDFKIKIDGSIKWIND